MTEDGEEFLSPEEAALATWHNSRGAKASVRSVEIRNGRAEVLVETDQRGSDYLDYVYCVQSEDGRWREVVSGNGPAHRWDDPTYYDWK